MLALLVIQACAFSPVVIQDAEFCGDMGPLGATCAHTQTAVTRDIPKPAWDTTRFGWICSSPDTFAQKKIELDSLCARPGSCTVAEQIAKQKVGAFLDTVESVSAKIKNRAASKLRGIHGRKK